MIVIKRYDYPGGYSEIIMHDAIENKTNNGKGGRKPGVTYDQVKLENINRRIFRVKRDIRRLALLNRLDRLMTLTFRQNIKDIDVADRYFKEYIYRVKQVFGDMKYIMVREYQERGAVHYHCLIDRFIPHKKAYEIWLYLVGSGSVNFRYKGMKGINYLLKYINKGMEEDLFVGKKGYAAKSYTCSKNLDRDLEKIMIKTFAFILSGKDGQGINPNKQKISCGIFRYVGPGVEQIMMDIEEANRKGRILYIGEGNYGPADEFRYRCIMIGPEKEF